MKKLFIIIIFFSILSIFYYIINDQRSAGVNQTIRSTNSVIPSITAKPYRKLSSFESGTSINGIYTNQKYGLTLRHPLNSNIINSFDTGKSIYIRIQNYVDKTIEEQQGHMQNGQYFLVIEIFDHQIGQTSAQTCVERIKNPMRTEINGIIVYRGIGISDGGDTPPVNHAVCINKPNADIYIQASENQENLTKQIIDSVQSI